MVSCVRVVIKQADRLEGPPRMGNRALREGVRMGKGRMDAHRRVGVWHTQRRDNRVSRDMTLYGIAY